MGIWSGIADDAKNINYPFFFAEDCCFDILSNLYFFLRGWTEMRHKFRCPRMHPHLKTAPPKFYFAYMQMRFLAICISIRLNATFKKTETFVRGF